MVLVSSPLDQHLVPQHPLEWLDEIEVHRLYIDECGIATIAAGLRRARMIARDVLDEILRGWVGGGGGRNSHVCERKRQRNTRICVGDHFLPDKVTETAYPFFGRVNTPHPFQSPTSVSMHAWVEVLERSRLNPKNYTPKLF